MLDPVPVTLLTGFLGSGKTTLLNRLLPQPAMRGCAVVINELGAIGLDHLLVARSPDNTLALLENGCLCCGVRDELAASVADLFERRERGEIPHFERLLIETTGLALPGPVLSLLLGDEALQHRLRLDGIVTTVDAMHGLAQLARHPESRQQAAVADRLLLTKTDLADAAALAELEAALAEINPGAPRWLVRDGQLDAHELLEILTPRAVRPWLRVDDLPPALDAKRRTAFEPRRGPGGSRHAHADIDTYCLTYRQPLPMEAVETALSVLLNYQGERILRVKGICDFRGEARPIVLHGVQQWLHEPLRLAQWPDAERSTQLVFIVQNLPFAVIADTFAHFLHAAGCDAMALPAAS